MIVCAAGLAAGVLAVAGFGPRTAAQEGVGEGQGETPVQEESPDEAPQPLSGDRITLKSGQVIQGVQVIRSTPKFYEVQMIEGVKPVRIPRRQVKSIKWDDIDPIRQRLIEELMPDEPEESVVSAEQLAPELRSKMTRSLGERAIDYENEDFIEVLEELARNVNLTIRIHESVEQWPAPDRAWTVELPPGTTMLVLLQDQLLKAFPDLHLDFQVDRVVVLTDEAASARETAETEDEEPESEPQALPEF